MHTDVNTLFSELWNDYVKITPSADAIRALLGGGDTLINDHIALRTFNHASINLEKLAAHLLALGYEEKGDYVFEKKKLVAKHYEHADTKLPKVFISELLVEQLSEETQKIISLLLQQMDDNVAQRTDFLYSGTHWTISEADYEVLVAESEYAAWMSVWGFRANHFTVSVNHLAPGSDLSGVNQQLKDAGFTLNTSGGEIKGGANVGLAQSSTMADHATVQLADTSRQVPSCFYEFAERFPMANGELYQGFVAASADKIFESTNTQ